MTVLVVVVITDTPATEVVVVVIEVVVVVVVVVVVLVVALGLAGVVLLGSGPIHSSRGWPSLQHQTLPPILFHAQ